MTRFRLPSVSGSEYSYTPAGQKRCSGPAYTCREISVIKINNKKINQNDIHQLTFGDVGELWLDPQMCGLIVIVVSS